MQNKSNKTPEKIEIIINCKKKNLKIWKKLRRKKSLFFLIFIVEIGFWLKNCYSTRALQSNPIQISVGVVQA